MVKNKQQYFTLFDEYLIMASRNRRRQTASLTLDSVLNSGSNTVQQTNSRYDMSYPQNWTVSQLRAELEQNDIPFSKSDRKSRLIQLCREHGLIINRNSNEAKGNMETSDEKDLSAISKSVEELQKSVQLLTGHVNKLLEASNSVRQDTVISNRENVLNSVSTQPSVPPIVTGNAGALVNASNVTAILDQLILCHPMTHLIPCYLDKSTQK